MIIKIEDLKRAILSLGEKLKEAEAIGICGSLVRGDFSLQSDIDIFVVVQEKKPGIETDRLWWERITEVLKGFRRDVTVLVYSVKGLENISNWYVLRLASEGILLFDKGNIAGLFQEIITVAQEAGLVEEKIGNYKVWRFKDIKIGEIREIKVK